ncbi:metal-dependent hydrolase [Chloroflexota bacterium]
MLILGHTGLTLGITVLLNRALTKGNAPPPKGSLEPSTKTPQARASVSRHLAAWFTSLANRLDIRILLIGALLPDIIDKPVGQLLFRETFSNGRIFSHTLLFLALITASGIFLQRSYGKNWLLVLSLGTSIHLILDEMWLSPKTLFWPLFGFTFEKIDLTGWTGGIFYALLHEPSIYIPELVGGVILVTFAWILVRNRKVSAFIKNRQL